MIISQHLADDLISGQTGNWIIPCGQDVEMKRIKSNRRPIYIIMTKASMLIAGRQANEDEEMSKALLQLQIIYDYY